MGANAPGVTLDTLSTEPKTGAVAPMAPERAQRISVIVYHGDGAKMALLAPGVPVTVGRGDTATIAVRNRALSREHARFLLADGRITVEDLGSTNGTWIGGQRIARADLDVGDEVVLGGVITRVHAIGPSGESLGVEGERRFFRRLDEELARAVEFRRPFALLTVLATHEPPPADRTSGVELVPSSGEGDFRRAPAHVEGWAARVSSALRTVDRMALYGPDAVLVLLPEISLEGAEVIARTILAMASPACAHLRVGIAVHPDAGAAADELIELSRRAAQRATDDEPVQVASTATWLDSEVSRGDAIVVGQAMRELIDTASRVAASRVPVVLLGETGTGKEVLARLVHDRGPRRSLRMVRVNCGAIPASLVESTLFGHERGAFTGAVQQQRGVFEEADGGTVFLDEIGELPLPAQAALLRVLETGSFCRVGASREIRVDVRVIAATHRDLEAMVAAGAFRADLFYRLNTMTLVIPPLRERTDELEPLVRRFLRMANEANDRALRGVDPEALALLKAYAWPGNVRELKNAIERAVVVAEGSLIGARDLPARVRVAASAASAAAPRAVQVRDGDDTLDREEERATDPGSPAPFALDEAADLEAVMIPAEGTSEHKAKLLQFEAKLILEALEAAHFHRGDAAKALGMPVRTLNHKVKVLGIKVPQR